MVRYQHRLRGSVKSVNGDLAEDHPLGQGDEKIAGAAYHVNLSDGFCAVGHCANGLGAADTENAVDAGDGGGDHDCGRSGRGAQNDFFDAGNAGGNGRHKHRRGVGGGAAGGVDSNALHGNEPLSQAPRGVHPAFRHAAAVVVFHSAGGEGEGFYQSLVDLRLRVVYSFPRDFKIVRMDSVQEAGVSTNRLISVAAHVVQNTADRLLRGERFAKDLEGAPARFRGGR